MPIYSTVAAEIGSRASRCHPTRWRQSKVIYARARSLRRGPGLTRPRGGASRSRQSCGRAADHHHRRERHFGGQAGGRDRRYPRFTSPQKLVSYLGLNPRVRQSVLGLAQHRRISKVGRSHARAMPSRSRLGNRQGELPCLSLGIRSSTAPARVSQSRSQAVTVVDPRLRSPCVAPVRLSTSSSISRCAAKSHHLAQQIGVGALLRYGAKPHHLIGHRRISVRLKEFQPNPTRESRSPPLPAT